MKRLRDIFEVRYVQGRQTMRVVVHPNHGADLSIKDNKRIKTTQVPLYRVQRNEPAKTAVGIAGANSNRLETYRNLRGMNSLPRALKRGHEIPPQVMAKFPIKGVKAQPGKTHLNLDGHHRLVGHEIAGRKSAHAEIVPGDRVKIHNPKTSVTSWLKKKIGLA